MEPDLLWPVRPRALKGSVSSMYPSGDLLAVGYQRRPVSHSRGSIPGTAKADPRLRASPGICHELGRGPMTPPRAFSDSALVAASGVQGQCHRHWPHLLRADGDGGSAAEHNVSPNPVPVA